MTAVLVDVDLNDEHEHEEKTSDSITSILPKKQVPLKHKYPKPLHLITKSGKSFVNICGIITDIRFLLDKKKNKMAFVKIEDFNNTYEAVVFGSVFPNIEDKLQIDSPLLLRGRLNSEDDDPVIKIICEEAYDLEAVPAALTEAIYLNIDKAKLSEDKINYIKNTLKSYPGKLPIYFKVLLDGKEDLFMVSKKIKVSVNTSMLMELEKILQLGNIKVKVK